MTWDSTDNNNDVYITWSTSNTDTWSWTFGAVSFIEEETNMCEIWHDKQGNPTTNKKLRRKCPLFRNDSCLLKNSEKDCILKLKNRLLFLK